MYSCSCCIISKEVYYFYNQENIFPNRRQPSDIDMELIKMRCRQNEITRVERREGCFTQIGKLLIHTRPFYFAADFIDVILLSGDNLR